MSQFYFVLQIKTKETKQKLVFNVSRFPFGYQQIDLKLSKIKVLRFHDPSDSLFNSN